MCEQSPVQYSTRMVSHGTLIKQSSGALTEEVWLKVIDGVWLHYAWHAQPPPQTSPRRGSEATWTCSLPCSVWVTCTQEGAVIHHHPLDQIGWLTVSVKHTTDLPGWACSALLTADCLWVMFLILLHKIMNLSHVSPHTKCQTLTSKWCLEVFAKPRWGLNWLYDSACDNCEMLS